MNSKNDLNFNQRRNFLKVLAGIPFLPLTGLFGTNSSGRIPEVRSNSNNSENEEQITQPVKKLPEGKLGNLTVSRSRQSRRPLQSF